MTKYKKLDFDELATLFIEYTDLHEKLFMSNQKHLAEFLMEELLLMRNELRKRGCK